MQLRYLGTAAAEGWPATFCTCEACLRAQTLGGRDIRTRSQVLVDDTLLIDLPPDTYAHMISGNLDLSAITTLLVTHSHQDHFYPAELLLRGEPYAHDPKAPVLHVYGNERVYRWFETSLWQDDSPNLMERIAFHEVKECEQLVTEDGYSVTPLAARHDPNERCLLYLVEKDGTTILHAHDTGRFPEETLEYLGQVHLSLVNLDCTGMLQSAGSGHMGLPDDLAMLERLAVMGSIDDDTRIVLTHFSHNGGLTHEAMTEAVREHHMIVAYDGMRLEVR